jgi:hypothetical protein
MSRFRDGLAKTRLSILELFYPNLTAEERITVEPFLQTISPPGMPLTQLESGLKIMNKLIQYKKQSRAKEDRPELERLLAQRKNAAQQTLDLHYQKSGLQD